MRTPAQWLRRMKRRKPGVYAYRTRRHLAPWRTEWGYAGKARDLDVRKLCHLGQCHHVTGCETEKPWMDLSVYRLVIRLPWWLGFDFITLSLETLVILALRPRYNVQKNPRRDKVGIRQQRAQRSVRESMPGTYRARLARRRFAGQAVRITGLLCIIIGIGGYLWNR